MDLPISAAPISPLRQRLIDDMGMRRFSRETQRNYIRDVGRFASFLGRPPDTATATRYWHLLISVKLRLLYRDRVEAADRD